MKKTILLIGALLTAGVAQATTTFTAEITNANGQLTPKLAWSSNLSTCEASGHPTWTGNKPASGTATLPAITMSGTYTLKLTCTGTADSSATVTWTLPAQNTDGSALTNLASTKVYYGTEMGALTTSRTVAVPATTTAFTGLAPGTWRFQASAVNASGVESARSAVVQKVIGTAPQDAETVTLIVNPIPMAPTGVTVQ